MFSFTLLARELNSSGRKWVWGEPEIAAHRFDSVAKNIPERAVAAFAGKKLREVYSAFDPRATSAYATLPDGATCIVILSAAKDLSRFSLRSLRHCGTPVFLRFFSAFPLCSLC